MFIIKNSYISHCGKKTSTSPLCVGDLFAVKGSVDQVDDRALDIQRQIVAGILFIYMTVLVFIISIGTTSLEIVILWRQQTLGAAAIR